MRTNYALSRADFSCDPLVQFPRADVWLRDYSPSTEDSLVPICRVLPWPAELPAYREADQSQIDMWAQRFFAESQAVFCSSTAGRGRDGRPVVQILYALPARR